MHVWSRGLLTSGIRDVWSGRAQPPPLIVLLILSWSLFNREMNLQLLSPRGWAISLPLQDHRGTGLSQAQQATRSP